MAHRIGRGFVAQQQCQCINENGFSSAGFAGQEVETGGELHGDVVDDRVVFYPQFQQHSEFSLAKLRRSVAGKHATGAGRSCDCKSECRYLTTGYRGNSEGTPRTESDLAPSNPYNVG